MNESNPNEDKSRRFGFRVYAEFVYKGKQRAERKQLIDSIKQQDNNDRRRLTFEEYRSAENRLQSAGTLAGIITLIIFVIILVIMAFGM